VDQRPKLLYPSLVIAAISVTLFSLLGIATLTGMLPIAHSNPQELLVESASGSTPVSPASTPVASPTSRPTPAEVPSRNIASGTASPQSNTTNIPASACAACGTVESISTVERKGNSTGLGAVAGGLTGLLLGNQVGQGNGRTGMTIAGGAGGAYLGNRIEQNMHHSTSYRITVRMDDGKVRTLHQHDAPDVAIGRHVEVVGNTVVPRS